MKPTIDFLMKRKAAVIGDLKFKVDVGDYHGVADCAMDLREIEAQIDLLTPESSDAAEAKRRHVADWTVVE